MKYAIVAAVGIGLLMSAALADEKAAPKSGSDLKDTRQKASYALGLQIGKSFKSKSVDVDPDLIARGIKDALGGGQALMTDQQINETMMAFQKEVLARQETVAKEQGEKNKKEGEAFLAANKQKPGVKTLPSGLQYKVLKEGTGKTPKATDTVQTNYRGTLLNGSEFDSSEKNGGPASFPVNRVIPGWTEALQLMKVGSKWQLFIPAELAYGETSPPGSNIGPNSLLVFDIELLGILQPGATPP